MRIRVEDVPGATVVTVDADCLDLHEVKEFKRLVLPLLKGRTRVVIDLMAVNFIDSTGLGGLISCKMHSRENDVELSLCGLVPQVRKVFELVQMHQVFAIDEDRATALARIARPRP